MEECEKKEILLKYKIIVLYDVFCEVKKYSLLQSKRISFEEIKNNPDKVRTEQKDNKKNILPKFRQLFSTEKLEDDEFLKSLPTFLKDCIEDQKEAAEIPTKQTEETTRQSVGETIEE